MTAGDLTFPGMESSAPARRRGGPPILAATPWATNGELVVALSQLGYLPDGRIIDPTYGQGTWWERWRPDGLIATDLATGVDVRALPFPDNTFAAAVFDPPHLPSYGEHATSRPEWRAHYGITASAPKGSRGIDELYRAGIIELARVVRPGGFLTVKSTDYVNGCIYQPMAGRIVGWLTDAGFDVVDTLVMLRSGPLRQDYAEQRTSWRNYSTATVARRRHDRRGNR